MNDTSFGILERKDQERRSLEVQARERAQLKRANRDLKTLALTGKISRFLQKSAIKNSAVSEAVNQIQNEQGSIPQIVIPPSKENDIEVKDPKNFGSNIEIPQEGEGGLPSGDVNGQLLVWNEPNEQWNLFTPPSGNGKFIFYWDNDTSQWGTIQQPSFDNAVLAYTGNNLGWIQIDECVPPES